MVKLKNKFAIGCIVQWYEIEMVEEYLQSVKNALDAIDNKKISKELEWTTKYDFNEAIDLTVRWYLDNPEWLHQSI